MDLFSATFFDLFAFVLENVTRLSKKMNLHVHLPLGNDHDMSSLTLFMYAHTSVDVCFWSGVCSF